MVINTFVFGKLSCLFLFSAEVQAIASLIEKQAQIVVKQKEVSEQAKTRKEAVLAQYANVTDEEEYPFNACFVMLYFYGTLLRTKHHLVSQGQGSGDPVWRSFFNICTEDEEEQAAVGIPSDRCILFYSITLCNKHDHFRRQSLLWLYTVYSVQYCCSSRCRIICND